MTIRIHLCKSKARYYVRASQRLVNIAHIMGYCSDKDDSHLMSPGLYSWFNYLVVVYHGLLIRKGGGIISKCNNQLAWK